MSDTSSCPNDPCKVSDHQVDVLTGFVLRSDLGTSQPPAEAWNQLLPRLVLGDPPGPLASSALEWAAPPADRRRQQMLLTIVPRITSVGAALVMLVLFVNSSLGLLHPGVFGGQPAEIIHPQDGTTFVMDKLNDRNPPVDRPTPEYTAPVVLRNPRLAEDLPVVVLPTENPSTFATPQMISPNAPIWTLPFE